MCSRRSGGRSRARRDATAAVRALAGADSLAAVSVGFSLALRNQRATARPRAKTSCGQLIKAGRSIQDPAASKLKPADDRRLTEEYVWEGVYLGPKYPRPTIAATVPDQ